MSIQTDETAVDVVIVGAGPVGLLLAGDLATAGVRTVVLERSVDRAEAPKANGVVGRAAVELRRRGLLRRTGLRVLRAPRFRYGPFTLRLGLLRSPLHILPIPQRRLEELLERRAVEQGASILRGHEVSQFQQDDHGVILHAAATSGAATVQARYLVGCDGAHSLVRKQLGIRFPGTTSAHISRLARVTIPTEAAARAQGGLVVPGVGELAFFQPNMTEHGSITIAPATALDRSAPPDLYILSTQEPRANYDPNDELPETELRASVHRVIGAELPFTAAYAARSLVANSRQATHYRTGRVFLAGDAAHVFSAGGSALNVGLGDATVLAKTLITALREDNHSDTHLLDSYETQRQPAGARALSHTRIQHDLEAADATGDALRGVFAELLRDRTTARRVATLIEG